MIAGTISPETIHERSYQFASSHTIRTTTDCYVVIAVVGHPFYYHLAEYPNAPNARWVGLLLGWGAERARPDLVGGELVAAAFDVVLVSLL